MQLLFYQKVASANKIIQMFKCTMRYQNQKNESPQKGRLIICENKLLFYPKWAKNSFRYTSRLLSNRFFKIHCNSYLFNFKDEQILSIKQKKKNSFVIEKNNQVKIEFNEFYSSTPFEILSHILSECKLKKLFNIDFDFQDTEVPYNNWSDYYQEAQLILKQHINVTLERPIIIELKHSTISDIYQAAFTDAKYKNMDKFYQCPTHYFLQEKMNFKNIKLYNWSPAVFEIGNQKVIPNSIELPERDISYEKIIENDTFFGEITSKVKCVQKLLILNEREFWVFQNDKIEDQIYSENYEIQTFYHAHQLNKRESQLKIYQSISWQKKLFLVTDWITNQQKLTFVKLFDDYYKPFILERIQEFGQNIQECISKRDKQFTLNEEEKLPVNLSAQQDHEQLIQLNTLVSQLQKQILIQKANSNNTLVFSIVIGLIINILLKILF